MTAHWNLGREGVPPFFTETGVPGTGGLAFTKLQAPTRQSSRPCLSCASQPLLLSHTWIKNTRSGWVSLKRGEWCRLRCVLVVPFPSPPRNFQIFRGQSEPPCDRVGFGHDGATCPASQPFITPPGDIGILKACGVIKVVQGLPQQRRSCLGSSIYEHYEARLSTACDIACREREGLTSAPLVR